MFCPRCGQETDENARYCGSCGAEMQRPGDGGAGGEPRSFRDRAGDLIGRSPRERFVTGGIVVAIVVAIIAFFALDTETENGDPGLSRSDAEAVDSACIVAKQSIAEAAARALRGGEANLEKYSASVLRSIVEFRSRVRSLAAGSELAALDAALLAAATEAGELSRVVREDPSGAVAQARSLEDATGEIEAAIAELGLTGCADVPTVPIASN
jgi:hypothetical protein